MGIKGAAYAEASFSARADSLMATSGIPRRLILVSSLSESYKMGKWGKSFGRRFDPMEARVLLTFLLDPIRLTKSDGMWFGLLHV